MKKTLLFVLLLCTTLISPAQDASKIKHKDTFKMTHRADQCSPTEVEAVRIGEFYWLTHSKTNRHFTWGSGGNWTQQLEDEKTIPMSTLEKYFTDNNLNMSYLSKFDNGDFEKYYGRHYNQYSVYGNWSSHSQHRRPIMWNTEYFDPETGIQYPSGFDMLDKDPYMWRTPQIQYFQQLFAMCRFNSIGADENSAVLTGRDARIDLGAKEGDNPLAFDIPYNSNDSVPMDWFATSVNRYGFSLMPAGQTKEKETDFTLLFNGVTFAIHAPHDGPRADNKILKLTDKIEYEDHNANLRIASEDTRTWVPAARKWSTVRMCRPLTPAELGYELFYSEAAQNIEKIEVDSEGNYLTTPTRGYKVLDHGYLRGFYSQYFIYETDENKLSNGNQKYTVADMFRFAKCVEDPFLPEPDCDCSRTYLTDHLVIETDTENSYEISRNIPFTVIAPNNNPDLVKIGLFNSRGDLIDENIGSSQDGEIYQCVITKLSKAQNATIRPYIEGIDEQGRSYPIPIGRLLQNEKSAHIIDHLHVHYEISPKTENDIATLDNDDISLTGHVEPYYSEETDEGKEKQIYIYAVDKETDEFKVRIPYNTNATEEELAIGLFSYSGINSYGEDYICDIDFDRQEVAGGRGIIFNCRIPLYDAEGLELLLPEGDYVIIPYYKNSPDRKKVSKTSQSLRSMIDRLPIYVNDDLGWGRSNLKSATFNLPQQEDKIAIKITPNPVEDIFTISGDFQEVLEVRVYNLAGKLVKIIKNSDNINVSDLMTGVYKVGIKTNKGYTSETIMKK